MKDWKPDFQKKLVSAEQAAGMVKNGDSVVFTAGREAHAIGLALAGRLGDLTGVKVYIPSPGYDFGWYDQGWEASFDITVGMPTATCQTMVDERRCDVDFGTLIPFQEITEIGADVLLTEVSPPDELGFCSFGASLWNKKRHIQSSKMVIAEINPNLIRTFGDNFIHVSDIHYFVEHMATGGTPGTGSLAGRALKKPEPYLKNIAEYVGSLIKDGSTIQIGVGRTTEPLVGLGLFNGRKDLGWHSEATPPGVISLVQKGVINGSRKTINTGKCVVTSIGGSTREEMEWVHMNPLFELVDVAYLEDIRVISQHDNMVAINNALAIDITGQITAEGLGTQIRSLAGGQIAFVFGAWLSKGGQSITVIPSTAQNGTISRIMPFLPQGTPVTVQRNMADYVVTEWGIAHIKGKTIRQRAQELIAVAHPDHRAELKKIADKRFWP
ncbi:MAG: 4-hydroxybutyrate CoA-transferase [Chloroflexi bacterium]|nr:4-hydroxybutyrate CoA-transferase [Chloroflexota bacterium]